MAKSFKNRVLDVILSGEKLQEKMQGLIKEAATAYLQHGNTQDLSALRSLLEEQATTSKSKSTQRMCHDVVTYIGKNANVHWNKDTKTYAKSGKGDATFDLTKPFYAVEEAVVVKLVPKGEADVIKSLDQSLARLAKNDGLAGEVMQDMVSEFIHSQKFRAEFARRSNARLATKLEAVDVAK